MASAVVDLLILLVLALYAFHGYRRGFLLIFAELVTFGAALVVAILLLRPAASAAYTLLHVPKPFNAPVGVVAAWLLAQLVGVSGLRLLFRDIPTSIHSSTPNRLAGAAISALQGVAIAALLLTLVVVAPIGGLPRDAVLHSWTGSLMVRQVANAERYAAGMVGDAVQDSLSFLSIKLSPEGKASLRFRTSAFHPAPRAEAEMLSMINQERRKAGLSALAPDETLRALARAHSSDMLMRGYFSHTSADGRSPFDRMRDAGVTYALAGENLALAPTLRMAHHGLMNSPHHRANILNPEFTRVGIGIEDAGIYGLMVTQDFAG